MIVQLIDGWLGRRLNTDDLEVASQVLRLLLWHAIEHGKLQGGMEHPAWIAYGGPIARATKCLLQRLTKLPWGEYKLERHAAAARLGLHVTMLDWLTNHKAPVSAAAWRRHRGRKLHGRHTPISKSWQFRRVGQMIHSGRRCFYGRVMIGYTTFSWRLAARNRAEAEELVRPAVEARRRVSEAARHWRECPAESPEAKAALAALLAAQRRFRDVLLAVGAKHSKGWAGVVEVLKESPFDEASRRDPARARRYCVEELLKHRNGPPLGHSVTCLLAEVRKRFHVGKHAARAAYDFAMGETGIRTWSTKGGRPWKRAS
jgi:hypothetical protein